jgi:hypothetical protein
VGEDLFAQNPVAVSLMHLYFRVTTGQLFQGGGFITVDIDEMNGTAACRFWPAPWGSLSYDPAESAVNQEKSSRL